MSEVKTDTGKPLIYVHCPADDSILITGVYEKHVVGVCPKCGMIYGIDIDAVLEEVAELRTRKEKKLFYLACRKGGFPGRLILNTPM